METPIVMSYQEIQDFATKTLTSFGLIEQHAIEIADSISRCERDDCKSHGLHRLLMCIASIRSGEVNQKCKLQLDRISNSLLKIDAQNTLSPIAFNRAKKQFVDSVKSQGIAAMAINNCLHFSALWTETEDLVSHDIACMICLPSHAWVAPYGATGPLLGTNPLAFGWPRSEGAEPFIFDFATSASARGEIELHARDKTPIPLGWAIDAEGSDTTNAESALRGAMRTFGAYKGSALSIMIELLAGPLIGDLLSHESIKRAPVNGCAPLHGELILGFCPQKFDSFGFVDNHQRAENLFFEMERLGARLPSSRRYKARKKSVSQGIKVDSQLLDIIHKLLNEN